MIRIAHLTDSHTTSLAGVGVRPLLGKRALGYLSWRRKRQHQHSQQMLEATTRTALAKQPDAIVLTGDFLHIGLRQEMRQIKSWLQALAAEVPVLLVPGNHDYYAADSLAMWQQELGDLPVFGEPVQAPHDWPRRLTVGPVNLLGLCSAYPAPLTKADGQLGEQQRALLAQELTPSTSDNTESTHKLVALHHPAALNLSAGRKNLLDAAELQALLPAASALLHGHLHKNIDYEVNGVPCYCTASASSIHGAALASFRLLEFSATPAEKTVHSRLFVATDGTPDADFVER